MMRIITGTARGTKLDSLDGEATRPTSERLKEALFSMIQFEIEGRRVLDLFGGTGQLGLEALSRGAESATFVDSSRAASDIIIGNSRKCKLFDKCRISTMDSLVYLRGAAGRQDFNIIFVDPPYASGVIPDVLRLIRDGRILAPGGVIFCETDAGVLKRRGRRIKETADELEEKLFNGLFGGDRELFASYNVRRTETYGKSRLTLLEIETKEAEVSGGGNTEI